MKKFPYIHIILFVLTCFSTLAAGAFMQGVNVLETPGEILAGLPFAGTLMTILLFHEFGHYIASRKHHTDATLPYFIPAPSFIGTFGAFIKMRSPIITRSALVDIGASGPIAGFVVSFAACAIGLSMSRVVNVVNTGGSLNLGDSLLFTGMAKIILGNIPPGRDILLHPIGVAGWFGFFVTSLNLIPIGQLDGGHIAFALLGRRHRHVSIVLVAVMGLLGILSLLGLGGWEGWGVWAALMLILGIKHPPVLYWESPLDKGRRMTALISLLIFIITFCPSPIVITQ
jgi:membrane-associated protease RseP (regulator of RpoE activity)